MVPGATPLVQDSGRGVWLPQPVISPEPWRVKRFPFLLRHGRLRGVGSQPGLKRNLELAHGSVCNVHGDPHRVVANTTVARSSFPVPITLWFTFAEVRGPQAPAQETGIQADDACQALNCLELVAAKISSCF